MTPEHLTNFSKMCEEAIGIANKIDLPEFSFDKIAICGVGGSGSVGDLAADLLRYDSAMEVVVVKSYRLPAHIDENTLVFCVSYSGNTEETLRAFAEAHKRNCKIISVTSGGKLAEWSKKLNLPVILIPSGYQPRDAVPYMFLPILICLQEFGLKNFEEDLQESVDVTKKIELKPLDELAEKIKNSDVAIYGSEEFAGVIRRFKNEFNENAKITVKYDAFPELNHNEINGYERNGKQTSVILLRDKDEGDEIKVRIETTKEIFKDYIHSVHEIWPVGSSKLAKIVSYVYMASYLTAKIAELVGINRERVVFVDRLKVELKNKLNSVGKLEKNLF